MHETLFFLFSCNDLRVGDTYLKKYFWNFVHLYLSTPQKHCAHMMILSEFMSFAAHEICGNEVLCGSDTIKRFKKMLTSSLFSGGAPTSICNIFHLYVTFSIHPSLPLSVHLPFTISQELLPYDHNFWHTCVKWYISRPFFHFFLNLIFGVVRG